MRLIMNTLKLKSVFSRLMVSFLTIIVILSSFNLVVYKFYINNIEKEIVSNANERLDELSDKFDNYFKNMLTLFLKIYDDEKLEPLSGKDKLSAYQNLLIVNELISYRGYIPYITDIFILTDKSDFILSSSGTYKKQRFFSVFYKNDVYNENFWRKEQNKTFKFNIYKTENFSYYSFPNISTSQLLMPFVFKYNAGTSFIIAAFIDVNRMTGSMDESFINNFYIFDKHNNSIIYPYISGKNVIDDMIKNFENIDGFAKRDNSYLFSHISNLGELTYLKFLQNDEIKKQIIKTNTILVKENIQCHAVNLLQR